MFLIKLLLWVIWFVLSTAWQFVALMPVIMSFDSGGTPGSWVGSLPHILFCVGFMFGPPGLGALITYGLTKLIEKGASSMAAGIPLLLLIRIITLVFMFSGTLGFAVAKSSPHLRASVDSWWLGANLFWVVGVPSLIGLVITFLPEDWDAKNRVVTALQWVFSPLFVVIEIVYDVFFARYFSAKKPAATVRATSAPVRKKSARVGGGSA